MPWYNGVLEARYCSLSHIKTHKHVCANRQALTLTPWTPEEKELTFDNKVDRLFTWVLITECKSNTITKCRKKLIDSPIMMGCPSIDSYFSQSDFPPVHGAFSILFQTWGLITNVSSWYLTRLQHEFWTHGLASSAWSLKTYINKRDAILVLPNQWITRFALIPALLNF